MGITHVQMKYWPERDEAVCVYFLIKPFNHLYIFSEFKSDNNLPKYPLCVIVKMNVYICILESIVEKPHYFQYAK